MYDNPNRITYRFARSMAGTTVVYSILGPKGKKGDVWNYGIYGVTTALTTANSAGIIGSVSVGSTSDNDAYGEELYLGGVAAEDAYSVRDQFAVTASSTATSVISDYIVGQIPADTRTFLTIQETSDGAGTVFVTIDWAD